MGTNLAAKAEKNKINDPEFRYYYGGGFNHTGKNSRRVRRMIKRGANGRYARRDIRESMGE
jgi:hypothetical protein